ncbi:hypothetical protein RND81_13G118800, partial [Saponaria officinalis]
RKYTSSHIIDIQAKLSERALELLALPNDGVTRLLLDIGCSSGLSGETLSENGHQWIGLDISQSMLDVAVEREAEGDLLLADMGQGLGFRPRVLDGAISISAVQWLYNADKFCHEPRLRLNAFFGSLYKSLARGARAVLQIYPQNHAQRELISGFANCNAYDDDDRSGDDEERTVSISDRQRRRKRQKLDAKIKGREWILRQKAKMIKRGADVPTDSKYTDRKRKLTFCCFFEFSSI